jgi:hypothetical protein
MISQEEINRLEDQRNFIHDISSPLMVALGMLNVGCNILTKTQDIEKASEKLAKSKKALEKITLLLNERRSVLIKISEEIEGKT